MDTRYSEVQSDYMEYLMDARAAIRYIAMRCSCWSSTYDGADLLTIDSASELNKRHSMSVANGAVPGRTSSDLSSCTSHQTPGIKRQRSLSDFENPKQEVNLGLFLNTIFKKLENMHNNTFYVNLILTAVITRLCYYPQPLLKSFLLNYNMVLKPGVRSLFQVRKTQEDEQENTIQTTLFLKQHLTKILFFCTFLLSGQNID